MTTRTIKPILIGKKVSNLTHHQYHPSNLRGASEQDATQVIISLARLLLIKSGSHLGCDNNKIMKDTCGNVNITCEQHFKI